MSRKSASSTKLKKELMKKLMKISIQVECFIYKNKAITVEIAQNNLQEINSLKALNCHDARTLQVIEKLTRHMKNIIGEEKPQNTPTINLKEPSFDAKATSLYGRIDPNPTQICCHSNWQSREVTSPSILTNNIQEDHVDLTVESPVKEYAYQIERSIPTLKRIRKNVSKNLNTIQESTEKEKNAQLISASNPNLKIIQKIKRNLNSIHVPSRITVEAVPHKDIRSDACYSQDIFGESQSILQNCDDKVALQRQKFDSLTISSTKTSIENCKLKKSKTLLNSNVSDIRQEGVHFRNKTKKKSQNKTKGTEKTIKHRSNKNNTVRTTKAPKYKRKVAYYQPEINIKSLRYSTKNRTEEILLKHDNSITLHNSSNTTPEQPNMVNCPSHKTIENDLSWVENLKYVRQIVPENYDSKLSDLADNLWNNCTFCGLIEPDDFHVY